MPSLQDKICNALTLAGLIGVTVAGTMSLWPDAKADTPAELAPTVQETDATQLDTLEELPVVEELPEVTEKLNDTISSDTLSSSIAEPADSAALPNTKKTDGNQPDASTGKKKAEKEKTETSEPQEQKASETLTE